MNTYTYIYIYIYIYIYTCIYFYIRICICIYIYCSLISHPGCFRFRLLGGRDRGPDFVNGGLASRHLLELGGPSCLNPGTWSALLVHKCKYIYIYTHTYMSICVYI